MIDSSQTEQISQLFQLPTGSSNKNKLFSNSGFLPSVLWCCWLGSWRASGL